MKSLVALVMLIVCAAYIQSANAGCKNPEAQFIGNVKSIETSSDGECLVRISNFSFYASSGVCPLLIEETFNEGIVLSESQCQDIEVNSQFSGILFRDPSGLIRWEF